MDNIVDLKQLDYRDRLIKEYIDNLPKGGGSQLFCELEVDTIYTEIVGEPDEAHLYIKCYKGTILESDELQFARNTATPTWHYTGETTVHGVPVKVLVKKRRGWIIPKPYNLVRLYKVYAEEKSAASELYDYWEVLPKNRQEQEVSWQELLDDMIDTAGTLVAASNALIKAGAKEVYACATHGVLSGPAIERINTSEIKEVIITNTIAQPESKASPKIKVLSVGTVLGHGILRIINDESLSGLFTYSYDKSKRNLL